MTVIPPASHQKFYQFTPPLLRPIRIQIQIPALHKTLAPATQPFFSVITQRSSPQTGRGGGEKRCVTTLKIVYYTAVFRVVTQCTSPLGGGPLRDDTKNGCVAD